MQQARYRSCERDLLRAINTNLRLTSLMSQLNGNIYDRQQDGIGYDENMNKITPFSYLIVGETNITEAYSSASHEETVAVTYHLYHRSDSLSVVDEARSLLDDLKYYAEASVPMAYYDIKRIRQDTKQTIPDVDLETMHGILRLRYTVKHKTRY